MSRRSAQSSAVALVLAFLHACTPAPRASAPSANPGDGSVMARGIVVAANPPATAVGRDVLLSGGNAIDAAVAVGFALAVTLPGAGNVAGGGFMVIRFPDGRATTVDFREVAPQAATTDMFDDSSGAYSPTLHLRSYRAVGVPGTVAGLALAHRKYGRLPWARLVDPGVQLAEDGFAAPTYFAQRRPCTPSAFAYGCGRPTRRGGSSACPRRTTRRRIFGSVPARLRGSTCPR